MIIEIQTASGPQKVRVCDYCRTVCIPSGRFCSGRCARNYDEFRIVNNIAREPVPIAIVATEDTE